VCRRALTPKGTLVLSSGESDGHWIGPVGRVIKAILMSPFVGQKMAAFTVKPNGEDLRFIANLIAAGEVTPVIDRTYSLAEVPDAIRYLEQGHARGKVVIKVP
jgi:NADPH:quinone reductase-like Zn-dependent oxidoreductase